MQFTKGTTRNPLFQTQRDNTTESRVQFLHIRSNFSSLMINSPTTEVVRVVRVVTLYMRLSLSNDMQFPQTVRLVNHCFTTRTSCTGRTSRGLVYTPKSL